MSVIMFKSLIIDENEDLFYHQFILCKSRYSECLWMERLEEVFLCYLKSV